MFCLGEGQHIATGFIHGEAASLKTWLGDRDRRPPCFSPVLTATDQEAGITESHQDRPVPGHRDVGVTFLKENLLHLKLWFTKEWLERTLLRAGGRRGFRLPNPTRRLPLR